MKDKEKKGGRPSKLTPEVKKRLLDSLRLGNYYEAACAYAGIDYRTFRNWMKRGEEASSGQYFQFFHAVKRAEMEAESRMVAQWQSHMRHDWRAAKDFLARRFPERWANREKTEVTGKDGGPIEVMDAREILLSRVRDIIAKREGK